MFPSLLYMLWAKVQAAFVLGYLFKDVAKQIALEDRDDTSFWSRGRMHFLPGMIKITSRCGTKVRQVCVQSVTTDLYSCSGFLILESTVWAIPHYPPRTWGTRITAINMIFTVFSSDPQVLYLLSASMQLRWANLWTRKQDEKKKKIKKRKQDE